MHLAVMFNHIFKTFILVEYKTTWKENMRDVFGANWPIAWISPLIPSKQDGDGTHYTKPDKSKHQRTI